MKKALERSARETRPPEALSEEWPMALGRRLREARLAGKESQAALAARCHVSDRTIGLLEQGRLQNKPRASTIARLAIATGSDPEDWIKAAGLEADHSAIAIAAQQVKSRVKLDELEPPQKIKDDVHREIGERISLFRPADELRQELRAIAKECVAHVERRIFEVERLLSTISLRVDNLTALTRDELERVRRELQSSQRPPQREP
jgi:transcriptional regulator with XRE-family HTH domain